jgi:biopolymer transport protein ExbB
MTIGAATGLIGWTPPTGAAAGSPHAVTVRVSDGSLAATQSFNINVTAPGAWWDPAWPQRVRLTLDTTGLTETLTGFPLLVVLTPARIDYGSVAANGADLRFVADDQATVLPHEIEQWVPGGTSYVWVRVPLVSAGGPLTDVWLYYGNGAAAGAQNGAGLWQGYRAVWHLNGFTDATGNGHTGTNLGGSAPSTDAAGRIGRARLFDGLNDRVAVAHDAALAFGAGDSYTLTAWVNPETLPAKWQGLVTKTYGLWVSNTTQWAAGPHTATLVGGTAATAAWAHLMVVQDGTAGTRRLYVNGTQVAAGAAVGDGGNTGALWIGGMVGVSSQYFNGVIDEVRLRGAASSADWAAALVRSETDTFVSYDEP